MARVKRWNGSSTHVTPGADGAGSGQSRPRDRITYRSSGPFRSGTTGSPPGAAPATGTVAVGDHGRQRKQASRGRARRVALRRGGAAHQSREREAVSRWPMRLVVVHVAAAARKPQLRLPLTVGSADTHCDPLPSGHVPRSGALATPRRARIGHAGRSVPACSATTFEAYQAGQSSSRTRSASISLSRCPSASRARRGPPRHAEVRSPGPAWMRMPCHQCRSGRGAAS
jgi:hypothetical protein